MNIHGERYANHSRFITYCRGLNVGTTERELEHYEKIGAMLPVARVVNPKEYIIQGFQAQRNPQQSPVGLNEWPALRRLTENFGQFPYGYENLTDEQLVHCFDREMDVGDNPYLHRPGGPQFQPWDQYKVVVGEIQGTEIRQSTAEHYYSYWQVHQLHYVQGFPDLYKNAWLIEHIPEEVKEKFHLPRSHRTDLLAEFKEMRQLFDALSFWIIVYGREQNRTFANITEANGIRRLDDAQADAYRQRLVRLGGMVGTRFQLTSDDLYNFLRQLIGLIQEYERKERYKLAEELQKDAFCLEDLIGFTTGRTREEIANELGKVSIHDQRTFRHLVIATKERDYALDLLKRVANSCATALSGYGNTNWSFIQADANDLLTHCEQEGPGLFPAALSGMVAIGDEEYRQKFRRVPMYTNLKNVLTSYEYLLKDLAERGSQNVGGKTLVPIVRTVMAKESWLALFNSSAQGSTGTWLLGADTTTDFLNNLDTLLKDVTLKNSADGYWARNFLITCLARNMTVHAYPTEDSYYGDLFGPMLDAAIVASFYTWKLAQREGWI